MAKINKVNNHVLIIPDIRSALNVGALFRTADAIGINKVYLTGYSPRPTDQFGRIQKDIAKSALGAETWVSWEYKKTLIPLIAKLKKEGYTIIALEQDPRAIDYRTLTFSFPSKKMPDCVALIVGPEVDGLPVRILDLCDRIVFIPMKGKKESLNVSVAAGIALFRIF